LVFSLRLFWKKNYYALAPLFNKYEILVPISIPESFEAYLI